MSAAYYAVRSFRKEWLRLLLGHFECPRRPAATHRAFPAGLRRAPGRSFPRAPNSDTIPIAVRPVVPFNPVNPAGPVLPSLFSPAYGQPLSRGPRSLRQYEEKQYPRPMT
jgi:hypothetical protein